MKFSKRIWIAPLALTLISAQALAADQLECSLKSMNPSGQSQALQTKSAVISTGSSTPSGADVELAQGSYSAHAVLESVQGSEVFFIDIQDASGRESGLQTSGAAIRSSEISSTLKVSDAGDWIYVDCSVKN